MKELRVKFHMYMDILLCLGVKSVENCEFHMYLDILLHLGVNWHILWTCEQFCFSLGVKLGHLVKIWTFFLYV